jgi:hypothetical protein
LACERGEDGAERGGERVGEAREKVVRCGEVRVDGVTGSASIGQPTINESFDVERERSDFEMTATTSTSTQRLKLCWNCYFSDFSIIV